MQTVHIIAAMAVSIGVITLLNFAITGNIFLLCEAGEKKCEGLNVVECNIVGTTWETKETCSSLCLDGDCINDNVEVCIEGTVRCKGKVMEQCVSGERWSLVEFCQFGCGEFECLPSPNYSFAFVLVVAMIFMFSVFIFFMRTR